MTTKDGQPTTESGQFELTRLRAENEALAAEAAALREAADTLVERLAQVNLQASEEAAFSSAMQYGSEALAVREILDNPSPAVAALERRLAPQPCGHPGACVASDDEGTAYCRWCEDAERLAGAEMALDILHQSLKATEARAERAEDESNALRNNAIKGYGIMERSQDVLERADEELRNLRERLERAEALVPTPEFLCNLTMALEVATYEVVDAELDALVCEARALAARIKAAQRQGQEGGDDDV